MDKAGNTAILFAAFECRPFIKVGGLGDVTGSLPKALNDLGADVRTILPCYKTIPQEYKKAMKDLAFFDIEFCGRSHRCIIKTMMLEGVTYYFLDEAYYLDRDQAYGYEDDDRRMVFFCRALLEALPHIGEFSPQVIHTNDWHTALIPILLKEEFSQREDYDYKDIKTVFTIHNMLFQGTFPKAHLTEVIGLQDTESARAALVYGDEVNYMRSALKLADKITTVSPNYAKEICTAEYGEGAEEILKARGADLIGILNGIDRTKFDPGENASKTRSKEALQRELGLEVKKDVPLITLISRLTGQKGLDLVLPMMQKILKEQEAQFAILGLGEKEYEEAFLQTEKDFPGKVAVALKFDEKLSIRFYEGAEMILIPSKFEPCGLTQMIGMRYGAVPIVRETGGLADSVEPYGEDIGTGFVFREFKVSALTNAVKDAVSLYSCPKEWEALVRRCREKDFSWNVSAEKYLKLYRGLL